MANKPIRAAPRLQPFALDSFRLSKFFDFSVWDAFWDSLFLRPGLRFPPGSSSVGGDLQQYGCSWARLGTGTRNGSPFKWSKPNDQGSGVLASF